MVNFGTPSIASTSNTNLPRIKIKNFGPITETGSAENNWLYVNKVTVFIGDQGSGKSTIAKLLSTFMWMEKALVRGDVNIKSLQRKGKFKNSFLKYHRLGEYFKSTSEIFFEGTKFDFSVKNGEIKIKEKIENFTYDLPQIMYVPAERNFISYVTRPSELKISSESLQEFLTEFNNAKQRLKHPISLPVGNIELDYDKLNDILNLKGKNYKIRLSDSSSGFQSLIPLFLVSEYLAKAVHNPSDSNPMSGLERQNFSTEMKTILEKTDFTEEQRRLALSVLSSKFNKKAFINIVEEPEQNLFPNSQWKMLNSLLKLNNLDHENKLIITTHSPYIINYLSIVIQAEKVRQEIENKKQEGLLKRLFSITPEDALLKSKHLSVYQLENGRVAELPNIHGIPSDDNYLNQVLRDGNSMIDEIFEIEDELI